MGFSSGTIPNKTIAGSHRNYLSNTNLSLAVSNLTDSEKTKARMTGTDFSSYLRGPDSNKTHGSTANVVSNPSSDFLNLPPLNSMADQSIGPFPKSHNAVAQPKKRLVLNRSDTIEEELMGRFSEKVLSAEANLLYDLRPRHLDDDLEISEESIIEFEQIPAHTKIMTSNKIVNRAPLLQKGSCGKWGEVYSEGGRSDDSGRNSKILQKPVQDKRCESYFKTNNDFVMGIQEVTLNALDV
jgi:hypothetical protein